MQIEVKIKQQNETHLSNRLQTTSWLQFVDTMALWLAVGAALWHWTLAATTADTHAVDDESLLCLEAQTTCLVWAGWAWGTHQFRQLTELPDADTQQVTEDIRLLLSVQLLDITIGSHVDGLSIDLATKSKN